VATALPLAAAEKLRSTVLSLSVWWMGKWVAHVPVHVAALKPQVAVLELSVADRGALTGAIPARTGQAAAIGDVALRGDARRAEKNGVISVAPVTPVTAAIQRLPTVLPTVLSQTRRGEFLLVAQGCTTKVLLQPPAAALRTEEARRRAVRQGPGILLRVRQQQACASCVIVQRGRVCTSRGPPLSLPPCPPPHPQELARGEQLPDPI